MPVLFLRVATACTLLLPLLLLYTRAGTEIAIGIVCAGFLAQSALRRDWSWCRQPWLLLALPYWAWLVLASVVAGGAHGVTQALVIGRFFVLAAALSSWVLADAGARRWLGRLFVATAFWIALQSWQQYLTGTNLNGFPRWEDGALTGPFAHPRAGPAFLFVLFPALLPAVTRLGSGSGWPRRLMGAALTVLAVATMVLIGQRMPSLLMLLGLAIAALAVPRLRPLIVGAAAAGAVVLAATPLISPPTFAKLCVRFIDQMRHFSASSYGMLYGRALAIAEAHPLFGTGADSFRHACADPRYFVPTLPAAPALGGGLLGCNLHPHNLYAEAAVSAGWAGVALFALMAASWCAATIARLRNADPARMGAAITVILMLWPLASTSATYALPNAGWLFLALGWALSTKLPARHRPCSTTIESPNAPSH